MDKKTKRIINDIQKYNVIILEQIFVSNYYSKYFSNFPFQNNDVPSELINEYNKKLRNLFNNMITDHKSSRTLNVFIAIAAYFFGSILRDIIIDYLGYQSGDFGYIALYVIWIAAFVNYIYKAYSDYVVVSGIQKYIQNDIQDITPSSLSRNTSIENNSELIRLKKLESLYKENLITQDEYEERKRAILKDI